MALIKPSALVESIHGRVGGTMFKQVRGQQYAYTAKHKLHKSSVELNRAHRVTEIGARAWATLTPDARTAWERTAEQANKTRAGGQQKFSARGLFYSQHADNWYIGLSNVFPPYNNFQSELAEPFTVNASDGGPIILVASGPEFQGLYFVSFRTTFKAFEKAIPKQGFRAVTFQPLSTPSIDVTPLWTEWMTLPREGQYVWYGLQKSTAGIRPSPTRWVQDQTDP